MDIEQQHIHHHIQQHHSIGARPMVSYTGICPECESEGEFALQEVAIFKEDLPYLKQTPFNTESAPEGMAHELYGFILSRCLQCESDLMLHFNLYLHRYLSLLQLHFPKAYERDEEVEDMALLERISGDLSGLVVPDSLVIQTILPNGAT